MTWIFFATTLGLTLGLTLGALMTWLVLRAQLGRLEERLMASQTRHLVLEKEAAEHHKAALFWQTEAGRAREDVAQLEATVREERRSAEEKLALVTESQEKLSQAFSQLSSQALKSNNEAFLNLAKTTLEKYQEGAKHDLEKRQTAIDQLLKPVQDTLSKFDHKIGDLEKSRLEAYSGLSEQVRGLSVTHQSLVKALGTPRVRGRWGELQLRRVVEIAGMLEHCDFYEQPSVTGETGALRPDLIVRLPGGKTLVIDAKTPMDSYLEAMQTDDDVLRKIKLKDHARAIREHMGLLGQKAYWNQFQPSPELAVLFLPGESFFSAAVELDPSLIDQEIERTNIVIATPVTLIALLKVVAYSWQQEALAENAKAISELGRELYERLGTMTGHMSKVGLGLRRAVESYNDAVSSMERRVLVSARKFQELKVSTSKEIEELDPVDVTPRALLELPLHGLEDSLSQPSQP